MPSAIHRLIAFVALLNLVAVRVEAQRGGAPAGQDYTIHNFRFASGETLPDLRIHYITFGKPRLMRDDWKKVFDRDEIAESIRRIT